MSSSTNGTQSATSGFQEYRYEPSLAAAVIFTVLFGLSTVLHFFQMIRTRTWFMVPFCIGGIFETIGYIGRILSAEQNPGPYTSPPYIMQTVLLLVAPALFAASIYMELGRISIMARGEDRLIIRRTWLTKVFVTGDVTSFIMQAAGASLLTSGDASTNQTGQDVIVAGLFVQLIFFGLFVIASALFHRRISAAPTAASVDVPWRKHMISLYIVSILIFVRSVVRIVEFLQGYSGYIMSHEVFLYVFDALAMFCAVLTMNIIHPSEVAEKIREQQYTKTEGSEGLRMDDVSV